MITSLDKVMGNLAQQNNNSHEVISQTQQVVTEFDQRRPALVASTGSAPPE